MELFTFQRLDLISIGHDDVEESLGGCAKEIGKISRVNPQAKISRVIKRYRPSHEQASRSVPATAAAEPVHRSQERGIRLSGNDHWVENRVASSDRRRIFFGRSNRQEAVQKRASTTVSHSSLNPKEQQSWWKLASLPPTSLCSISRARK